MAARLEKVAVQLSSSPAAGSAGKDTNATVAPRLLAAAQKMGLDVAGGKIRRTSSRFCLGVEHGDYNGTELFGVGTDRYIWSAYKPNGLGVIRLYSINVAEEGVVEVRPGDVPPPLDPATMHTWARFPYGADYVLGVNGFKCTKGYDCVLFGNIPGGGMSRSASLSINLLLTMMEVNGIGVPQLRNEFQMIELSQQIENDYIGSPCGVLDQIMIYFAKAGMGTHFNPKTKKVSYVPLGSNAPPFAIMALDTGTNRPGLDKSTYKVRKMECDLFAAMLEQGGYGVTCLGDVRDDATYERIAAAFRTTHPNLVDRLTYIYKAQQNFYRMMAAWKAGDIETVGAIFREDGNGLRDEYSISGPELQTMCDIVRTIPGVWGERMLGGGDKGASGCIVALEAASTVIDTVAYAYPLSRPHFADKYAVHGPLQICDGVLVLTGML